MKNFVTKRFDYIDAIRGYAIVGVVLVHTQNWVAPSPGIVSTIAREGARGVQLFFIISALTLFMSMDARKNEEKKPILKFYIRRLFRIAPAFYFAIIVYTAYNGMDARFFAPNGVKWWYIVLTLFFLNGWHPETITSVVPGGWTIAVEMTFYIIVPFLFLKLSNIKRSLFALLFSLIFSMISSFALNILLLPLYPDTQKYIVDQYSFLWFFSQFPAFILGILLFHIITKYPTSDKTTSLLLLLFSFFLFSAFLTITTYRNLLPKHFLFGVAFLLFSLALHYYPKSFLVNKFIVLVGKLSFSIYLVHFMALNMMSKLFSDGLFINGNWGFLMASIIILAVSICVSYVSYRVIEIPGIEFGKRIIAGI